MRSCGAWKIEDNDVGLKSDRFVDGFDTISSFAANSNGEWLLEENTHRVADGISSSTMRMRLGIGEKT